MPESVGAKFGASDQRDVGVVADAASVGSDAGSIRHEGLTMATYLAISTPNRIRICDLSFRKAALYPTELLGHQ